MELLTTLAPSISGIAASLIGVIAMRVMVVETFRKLEARIEWLAWERIDEAIDEVEAGERKPEFLRNRIARTREFLKERPSEEFLNRLTNKLIGDVS